MKVYIVTVGEMYEGASIRSVHADEQSAVAAALKWEPSFEAWAQATDEPLTWRSGCDVLRVEEWEVEP